MFQGLTTYLPLTHVATMKRPLLTIGAALALAGCAAKPHELITGERTQRQFAGAPETVARCIARNAERVHALYGGTARPKDKGAWEVVVNIPSADSTSVLVAQLVPNAGGTSAAIWTTPHEFRRLVRGDLASAVSEGC